MEIHLLSKLRSDSDKPDAITFLDDFLMDLSQCDHLSIRNHDEPMAKINANGPKQLLIE
jgi:hypothetical protein